MARDYNCDVPGCVVPGSLVSVIMRPDAVPLAEFYRVRRLCPGHVGVLRRDLRRACGEDGSEGQLDMPVDGPGPIIEVPGLSGPEPKLVSFLYEHAASCVIMSLCHQLLKHSREGRMEAAKAVSDLVIKLEDVFPEAKAEVEALHGGK